MGNSNEYISYRINDFVANAIYNIDEITLHKLECRLADFGYVKRNIVNAFDIGKCLDGTDCPAWLCSQCGNLFEANGKYCTWCGSEIKNGIDVRIT